MDSYRPLREAILSSRHCAVYIFFLYYLLLLFCSYINIYTRIHTTRNCVRLLFPRIQPFLQLLFRALSPAAVHTAFLRAQAGLKTAAKILVYSPLTFHIYTPMHIREMETRVRSAHSPPLRRHCNTRTRAQAIFPTRVTFLYRYIWCDENFNEIKNG